MPFFEKRLQWLWLLLIFGAIGCATAIRKNNDRNDLEPEIKRGGISVYPHQDSIDGVIHGHPHLLTENGYSWTEKYGIAFYYDIDDQKEISLEELTAFIFNKFENDCDRDNLPKWPKCEFRRANTYGSDLFGVCLIENRIFVVSGYKYNGTQDPRKYIYKEDNTYVSAHAKEHMNAANLVESFLGTRGIHFRSGGLIAVEFHK